MNDPMSTGQIQSQTRSDSDGLKIMAIVVYTLFLAAFVSAYAAAILGVILAYVKRPDARSTIWESHFDAAISTFWVSLIVLIIGIPLCFILVGFPILAIWAIWFLYRVIKGLVRALEGRAYG